MRKEVLVFVNIIAPYNIPLFNRISQSFDNQVLFLFDQAKESNRKWEIPNKDIEFDYAIENSLHIRRSSNAVNGAALQRTIYAPFFCF